MAEAKYFAGVEAAQGRQAAAGPVPLEPFDMSVLEAKGRFARFSSNLAAALIPAAYAFSRRFRPLMPLAGLLHVTREQQVREILLRSDDFHTPFGPEMAELGNGAVFPLGSNGAEHARLHDVLMRIIRREDAAWIGQMSGAFTAALLDNSKGEIDVIGDLIKRVPAEVCLRYFGLECDDADAFGDWTMALSAFLFGDPYGKPEVRRLAMNARRRINAVIADALARAQNRVRNGSLTDSNAQTLVERLALLQPREPLSDDDIGALLMGLATGFIPTNSLAAGNMLQELLKRPDAMRAGVDAARAGDLEQMRKVVMEAGRLNPALAPGQWRHAPRDTAITIDGKDHLIKAGTTLLVSTMSALRDPRAWADPMRFRLDRKRPDGTPQEPDLVFGVGPHWCLGKYLALEQISALFMDLLKRPGLRRAPGAAGRLRRLGPFPRHLTLRFDTPTSQQSMFMVIAPVESGDVAPLQAQLEGLGNPAGQAIREAMDAAGVVHFASLTCIETDHGRRLCLELSVDGPVDQAIDAIALHAGGLLRPAFAHAGCAADETIAAFMRRHVVELHGKPWGATGLNYNGLGEFPVALVEKQARFADFTGRVLRDYVASETARGSHPMLAITHLRRILRGDPDLRSEATEAQLALMDEAAREGWDAFHLQTQANRLALARFRPITPAQAFARFLKTRDGRFITWPLAGFAVLWAWLLWPKGGIAGLGGALALGFGAMLGSALTFAALVTLFLILLRRAEEADEPDTSAAPLEKLRRIVEQENPPGYAQNHIMALGTLKTGWLRKVIHAFALWGIRVLIVNDFRPGFVINMGTIHYARWWRVPGTGQVAFYSNFDGSWESYLEDFITRARQGQTAAWSNWQGFPKTRFMLGLGASDGDAFKRWVRIQQQIVPFWYARFPALTSDQIRMNALIHSGLSLARNASEGEEWLRCFGSMPRMANRIETDEVQALVFRGMKRLPYSTVLTLRLPDGHEPLGEWLSWMRGKAMRAERVGGEAACAALVAEGVLASVPRPAGRTPEFALANALTITFGERPLVGDAIATASEADRATSTQAVFLALSAKGLARFEAPNCAPGTLLERFPYAFRMGMAGRGRVTGDAGANAPEGWRWGDDPRSSYATDAALMLYASSPERLAMMIEIHATLLGNHGGAILSQTDCAPAWPEGERIDFEHFGYRDGISQPVIKGTTRALRDIPERDLVEPGEFIVGYANNAGYLPPSPLLPVEADVRGALPVTALDDLSRFPDFGEASLSQAPRDLGRNGSYLVLRELKQDVKGFTRFVDDAARRLAEGGYRDLDRLVGQTPDREWVKAKLMGRWPNGRPLVGNPVNIASAPDTIDAENSNDFSYGEDDPHGLACPFGAHIRHTNPRDSKQPGDASEQIITNRHRILRRGRPYERPETGEKGLLFACLCTDIERQFEFVQQFWSNAPAFHGLEHEPDPIIGADPVDPRSGCPIERVFTIPTAAGPVRIEGLQSFVQTMAGGYFFLPSRSALSWLNDTALHARGPAPEGQTHG
ncbi:MAG: cytochrome P450 [Novosphingobium sp.]